MLKTITFNATFYSEKNHFKFGSEALFIFFFFQFTFLYGQTQIADKEDSCILQKGETSNRARQEEINSGLGIGQATFKRNSTLHIVGNAKIFVNNNTKVFVANNRANPNKKSLARKTEKKENKRIELFKKNNPKDTICFFRKHNSPFFKELAKKDILGTILPQSHFSAKNEILQKHIPNIYVKRVLFFFSINSNSPFYSKVFTARPPPPMGFLTFLSRMNHYIIICTTSLVAMYCSEGLRPIHQTMNQIILIQGLLFLI